MYSAPPLWVSNSTLSDAQKCPRSYFLKNIYKNDRGKKIAVVTPALTLGQSVHEVLEPLAKISVNERFTIPLDERLTHIWKNYTGMLGGFTSEDQEHEYYAMAQIMLERVRANPGPLGKPALRLSSPDKLPPRFFLSKEDNILLCGKIDWLEHMPATDNVHIIDFKTGKHDEDLNSLQLPIYCLLVTNLQKRVVEQISYWYLEREDSPRKMTLPDLETAQTTILKKALSVKKMRAEKSFDCPSNGCLYCRPYEKIVNGEAKLVNTRDYQDIFMLT